MTRSKTLRQTMTRATLKALLAGAVLYTAAGFAGFPHPDDVTGDVVGAYDVQAPVDAPTYPEQLAADHGCWLHTGPGHGVIPGHVIARKPSDREAKLYPAAVGFAIVLGPDGAMRTGDETPGTVTAFCP